MKNVTRAPFATALAFVAVLSGIRAIFEPESLPVYYVIGNFAYAWAFVYSLGGALILYGQWKCRGKFEAAGCALFAGGAGVQALMTLFFLGQSPFLTLWSVAALVAFALAGAVRVHHLMRGEVLVWFRGGGDLG